MIAAHSRGQCAATEIVRNWFSLPANINFTLFIFQKGALDFIFMVKGKSQHL